MTLLTPADVPATRSTAWADRDDDTWIDRI